MNNNTYEKWLLETPTKLDEWMLDGLKLGLDHLKMENGIISRIHNRDYTILQAASTIDDSFSAGDYYELSNTYCEAVVRQHRTISFIQAGNIPEMHLHPVYQSMHMESFIGAPILNKKNGVTGTLSFSAQGVRSMEFSEDEISFIEQMATKLSEVLINKM